MQARVPRREEVGVSADPVGVMRAASTGGASEIPHRKELEQKFGQDFSGVRAHFGKKAELQRIGAEAATLGNTVVFAQHSPSKRTVAHELAHVVQGAEVVQRVDSPSKSSSPEMDPELAKMWEIFNSFTLQPAEEEALDQVDTTKDCPQDNVGALMWHWQKGYDLLWGLTSGRIPLDQDAHAKFREYQKGLAFFGLLVRSVDQGGGSSSGDTDSRTPSLTDVHVSSVKKVDPKRVRMLIRRLEALQSAAAKAEEVLHAGALLKYVTAIGSTILIYEQLFGLHSGARSIAKGSAISVAKGAKKVVGSTKKVGSLLENTAQGLLDIQKITDYKVEEAIVLELLDSGISLKKVRTFEDLVAEIEATTAELDLLLEQQLKEEE